MPDIDKFTGPLFPIIYYKYLMHQNKNVFRNGEAISRIDKQIQIKITY